MSRGTTHKETHRFAPYIEYQHKQFLNTINSEVLSNLQQNPYEQNLNIEIDEGFFGFGYMLSNFPSILDMYGKFLAGLDISTLFDQLFAESNISTKLITAHEYSCLMAIINDKIIPDFNLGATDINSMLGSVYHEGRIIIRDAGEKAIEKFRATLRYKMLFVVTDQWKTHLEWNHNVISMYLEFFRLYTESNLQSRELNQHMRVQEELWPFTILEFQSAALITLGGSSSSGSSQGGGGPKEQEQWVKCLSGALSGASTGMMITGPWGAAGGAVVGLALSFM